MSEGLKQQALEWFQRGDRDLETAQIAFQAAQTGHLVLSTLHTNDAPGTVLRLVEMGIPAYVVASSLMGVLAQRLVLKLCRCKSQQPSAAPRVRAMPLHGLQGTDRCVRADANHADRRQRAGGARPERRGAPGGVGGQRIVSINHSAGDLQHHPLRAVPVLSNEDNLLIGGNGDDVDPVCCLDDVEGVFLAVFG